MTLVKSDSLSGRLAENVKGIADIIVTPLDWLRAITLKKIWRPTILYDLPSFLTAHLAWCTRHIHVTQQDWTHVLFTDESRFHLHIRDDRCRVYRRVVERFHDRCVIQRRPFDGGSVMMWVASHPVTQTALVVVGGILTGIKYRDEIIRIHVLPFVQQRNATLHQYNARPHVARVVTDFLIKNNVNVMHWPLMSTAAYRTRVRLGAALLMWPPKSAVDVICPVTCACENLE